MGLEGKIALVTGGAQGIGLAISERLAREGASVAVVDVDRAMAEEAARKIQSTGAEAIAVEIDVGDPASVAEGTAIVTSELGPAAILVNNAGVYRSTPLLGVSGDFWKLSLDVMLTGTLLMAQEVTPHMIRARWGRIINLGSMMSNVAYGEDVAYCTSKSGILGLTRSLAAELAKHNICVNTVCPGNVLTGMLEQTADAIEQRDGLEPGSWIKDRAKAIPLGRLGKPDDIANVVSFFCSEDANYITGQSLHVNGGLYQL